MALHSEVVFSCASTCACVIELAEVCVCHQRRESRLAVGSHSLRQVSSSPADSHTSLVCKKTDGVSLHYSRRTKKKKMMLGYLLGTSVLFYNDGLGPDVWVKVLTRDFSETSLRSCFFCYYINHNLNCCKFLSPLSVLCCFCACILTSEHDVAEFKSFFIFSCLFAGQWAK